MAPQLTEGTLERSGQAVRRPADKARRDARSGRGWYALCARIGLVAKGISYGIVGVLAIELAAGYGGKATSRGGALETLADETAGKVLLIALAVGFAAYALWRFLQAFASEEDDGDGDKIGPVKTWAKRAGYAGRGLVYAGLTFSAVKILLGAGHESETHKAHKTTADVLSWPGGRWLVAAAGVCVLAAGAWNAYRAVTKKFEDKWRTQEMSEIERKWAGRAGAVGHAARAVVFGLIGIFVVKAAVEYDAKEAIGLDGALQKLAGASYGPWLLGITAAGLLLYGVFCLFDARYRDVSASGGENAGAQSSG
jgi:Domain of Unknown Function (DUF1206)